MTAAEPTVEGAVEASAGKAVAPPVPRRTRCTPWLLTAGLLAALLVLIPVTAGLGAYPIPAGDVLASVAHRPGSGARPWTGYRSRSCGTSVSPGSCSRCSSAARWAARAPSCGAGSAIH